MGDDKPEGGERRSGRTTRTFYERVDADERVRHLFKGIDLNRLAIKLAKLIAMLLGGKTVDFRDREGKPYLGVDGRELTGPFALVEYLKDWHKDLNISDKEYDIVGHHLMYAMIDAGYEPSATEKIGAAMVQVEPIIVKRHTVRGREVKAPTASEPYPLRA